jgi:hypothetical protein
MSPVRAPSRVKMALSTTVEPCRNSRLCANSCSSVSPMPAAVTRTESMTPCAKRGGVESALPKRIESPWRNTTQSVQVPPTSTATT